jgi:Fic family protein
MLTAVEETSLWTSAKIRAIRELMDATVAYVNSASPKIYSRELIEVIFTQPYSRIGNIVEAKLGTRKTASKYLKELVAKGVLEERQEGRENIYINVRFLELLTSETNGFRKFH